MAPRKLAATGLLVLLALGCEGWRVNPPEWDWPYSCAATCSFAPYCPSLAELRELEDGPLFLTDQTVVALDEWWRSGYWWTDDGKVRFWCVVAELEPDDCGCESRPAFEDAGVYLRESELR